MDFLVLMLIKYSKLYQTLFIDFCFGGIFVHFFAHEKKVFPKKKYINYSRVVENIIYVFVAPSITFMIF